MKGHGIPLSSVIPWGRNYSEYADMFRLDGVDSRCRIAGIGDGPASFCSEFTKRGGEAIAIDPLYAHSTDAIRSRIETVRDEVLVSLHENSDGYHWDRFENPDDLARVRMDAMRQFMDHRENHPSRYIAGALPKLPLAGDSVDLCLCSHFLFTYAHLYGEAFHYDAIIEMMRVAGEARVFPLITTQSETPAWIRSLIERIESAGHRVQIEQVGYRFQRGADRMMRITR